MIRRHLEKTLLTAAGQFPVVSLTGPRQSGKTTLVRAVFPQYDYVSLEEPEYRTLALGDPRAFLGRFTGPVILDEAQRAPDLFSYIQTMVDQEDRPGRFILTGSQNFLLLQSITQSLAGRTAVLHLLPFTLGELLGRQPMSSGTVMDIPSAQVPPPGGGVNERLHAGFYPRIHDKGIPARTWLANYYQTYLERDVRNVLQVGDLETFSRFVSLCAGRCGQLLNLSSLASDSGVSHTTARRWLSVLEASFIISLLRPFHRSFNKRLVKTPKLYFLDTGLLCFLLGIRDAADLTVSPFRGPVFESFVFSELHKDFFNRGEVSRLHFWRDTAGHEVDFLRETNDGLTLVEAKSSQTFDPSFLAGIEFYHRISKEKLPAMLYFAGDQGFQYKDVRIVPWWMV